MKPWHGIPCDFIGWNKIYLCIMYKVILYNWRCRNLVHLEANLAAFGKSSSFLQIAGLTWWLASYELVYSTYSAWYYLATRTHSPTSSRQRQMCLEYYLITSCFNKPQYLMNPHFVLYLWQCKYSDSKAKSTDISILLALLPLTLEPVVGQCNI